MTRRNQIHKWSFYALALLAVCLLDSCILPRYPLLGLSPMLLPLAACAVSVLEGSRAGAGFGMAVGLLWELAYPGGFGGLVFGMTLAGMLLGAAAQYVLSQSFPSYVLCCAALLALLDLLRVLSALLNDAASLPVLLQTAGGECLLSLVWSPLVWLLFRAVFRRVGGTRLA